MKNKTIIKGYIYASFLLLISVYGCKSGIIKNVEARQDIREFNTAQQKQKAFANIVFAAVETDAVISNKPTDDCADDPAIWIHKSNPSKSVVFGSNKKRGIHSYSLNGKEIQFVDYAKINNIDVRQNVLINGKKQDILAGSNRTSKSIDLFLIDSVGRIASKPDFSINLGAAFKPYGFCLYKDEYDGLFAFVNNKKGKVFQKEIQIENNSLNAKTVRELQLSSQVEGMVVSDKTHLLYVGEEQMGIHVFSAKKEGGTHSEMIKTSTDNNPNIRFDIEGLALLEPHYLVASSQGNFSYAIFDLQKNEYFTSFTIRTNTVDAVEETDGLEIYNGNLGRLFPKGALIVQDGFNYDQDTLNFQNYKIVDLAKIRNFLPKK